MEDTWSSHRLPKYLVKNKSSTCSITIQTTMVGHGATAWIPKSCSSKRFGIEVGHPGGCPDHMLLSTAPTTRLSRNKSSASHCNTCCSHNSLLLQHNLMEEQWWTQQWSQFLSPCNSKGFGTEVDHPGGCLAHMLLNTVPTIGLSRNKSSSSRCNTCCLHNSHLWRHSLLDEQ